MAIVCIPTRDCNLRKMADTEPELEQLVEEFFKPLAKVQDTICGWLGNNARLGMIVSGGQCGADLAGLEAAKDLGLDTGGWMPKGFRTENGPAPELAKKYGLCEMPTDSYRERTMANVDLGDATVAFLLVNEPNLGAGTRKTIGFCLHGKWCAPADEDEWRRVTAKNKPVLVINASRWGVSTSTGQYDTSSWDADAKALRAFLKMHPIRILNVAGHCEFAGGTWCKAVREFLVHALQKYKDTELAGTTMTDAVTAAIELSAI